MILLLFEIILFAVYYLITIITPTKNENSYFLILVLSSLSGASNAIIIFIINAALVRFDYFQGELFLFFVFAMLVYVLGQRVVRHKLLNITNEVVYLKRTMLINRILNTRYEKIDVLEDGKIQAGLNNDTETISSFANVVITALTGAVTLISCFLYLGTISLYGLIISVAVILIAVLVFFKVGRYSDTLWQEMRESQNKFHKYVNHMLGGFKELRLNKQRRDEFEADTYTICENYRDKRTKGDLGFADAFVVGELMFTLVVGIVAFIFPVIFKAMSNVSIRNYIFIFLYMTGPINAVLNAIPIIIRVRISYSRLEQLISELGSIHKGQTCVDVNTDELVELKLSAVKYRYENKQDSFTIGPLDISFRSGEVTFITGGNGSGKSTLAKLITGLYEIESGNIYLNDINVNSDELERKCSAIFSDFYLFEKLYGIDYNLKSDEIDIHLEKLKISHKLNIKNNIFSTVKLSSGQKKGLALMISILEDKPIYVLDEWAADQDPEFREYFYNVIIKELKNKNKCVIAITHDDKYFGVADKIYKVNLGKIENIKTAIERK